MARRRARRRPDERPNFWESLVFKWGTKLFLGVLIVVVLLTVVQCSLESPKAPSWDTQLTVPLTSHQYNMAEILERINQDGLTMDSAGVVSYSISEQLDTVFVDTADLSTPDLSYSIQKQLDDVNIVLDPLGPITVSATAALNLGTGYPGDQTSVSAVGFTVVTEMPAIAECDSVTVATGSARTIVYNNLGLDLDQVRLRIYDRNKQDTVGWGTVVGGIPAGVTDSVIIPLNGRTFTSALNLVVIAHTPGGVMNSISTRFIRTSMAFDTLGASMAAAQIDPDTLEFSQQIELDESGVIDTAVLASGALSVTLANQTAMGATVVVEFPDFAGPSGMLRIDRDIAANNQTDISLDLSQYRLIPLDRVAPQLLAINCVAYLDGSDGQRIVVMPQDGFSVSAQLTGLQFESVTGSFEDSRASFDDIRTSIDLPTGFDQIELTAATLTLEIENGIDLPGSLDISLSGNNNKQLSLTGDIDARGTQLISSISTIVNTDVADFLSPIPTEFEVSGAVTLGGEGVRGTLRAGDFIVAKVSFTSPMEFVLNESTVATDPERTEIDQSDIDKITDHVNELRLTYNIANALPVGAGVRLLIDPDSTHLTPDSADLIIELAEVPAGPVTGGLVTGTSQTGERQVVLSNADVRILENPELFIATELTLMASDGTVRVTGDNYIHITAWIEVDYFFDGEF
jgi:hypothetical protein